MVDKTLPTLTNTAAIADDSLFLVRRNGQTSDEKTTGADLKSYFNTTPTITGGTIDSTVIGGTTPAAGSFTTLTANTIDTGQGAVECYAMDQAVRTSDSVSFSGLSLTTDLAVAHGGTGASNASGARTNLGVGSGDTVVFNKLTLNTTAIASTREELMVATVSDSGEDKFGIANGTAANGEFAPTFFGYKDSDDDIYSLNLRGMTDATNDASDSSDFGIINVEGYRTTNASDPNNGTFSRIENRKLLTITNGTGVARTVPITIAADDNITITGTLNTRNISTDGNKLDTIETNADVTDTANVTAAGALMDSEVDADIKTLTLPANTTISTFGASLVDDSDASAARTTLGLGSIATQAADSVTITGGAISGITDLAIADGGTGAGTAGGARTNLGLGTIATQAANNVSISGGSITGIADLAIADGGTGASTALDAWNNLVQSASTTVEGAVEKATSAEVIAETADKYADAATMKSHNGIAKAWANFDGTGTISIRNSYNVSSITDNGTGLYTLNLSITMANSDYVVGGSAKAADSTTSSPRIVAPTSSATTTTTSCQVSTESGGNSRTDCALISVIILGEST